MLVHGHMQFSEGLGLHARLPKKYGADLTNVFAVLEFWLKKSLSERAGSLPKRGHSLFYEDAIFDDLMFRLADKTIRGTPSIVLVLARVGIDRGHRGKGYFSSLLKWLENKARQLGVRFLIESANCVAGGLIGATGRYARLPGPVEDSNIILDNDAHHWLYEPVDAPKEITITVSSETYSKLRRSLMEMPADRRRRLGARAEELIAELAFFAVSTRNKRL